MESSRSTLVRLNVLSLPPRAKPTKHRTGKICHTGSFLFHDTSSTDISVTLRPLMSLATHLHCISTVHLVPEDKNTETKTETEMQSQDAKVKEGDSIGSNASSLQTAGVSPLSLCSIHVCMSMRMCRWVCSVCIYVLCLCSRLCLCLCQGRKGYCM